MPPKPRFHFETMIGSKEPSRSRRTTDLDRPDLDQHRLDAGPVTHIHLNQRATMHMTQILGQLSVQPRLQNVPLVSWSNNPPGPTKPTPYSLASANKRPAKSFRSIISPVTGSIIPSPNSSVMSTTTVSSQIKPDLTHR